MASWTLGTWLSFALFGAAEEQAAATHGPDYAWLKGLFLAAIHLFAPKLRPWLETRLEMVSGFGAGMAISYIFLQLLPEIGEGAEETGFYLYSVVLLGFLLYLGIQRKGDGQVGIAGFWLYNWLLLYSIPPVHSASLPHMMLSALAVGTHLLHTDFELALHDRKAFLDRWRYLLALAPLVGVLTRYLYLNNHPGVFLIALGAGSLMFSAFKEVFENKHLTEAGSFTFGVLVYSLLLLGVSYL